MKVSNILKFSVLVISFAMFCYQLNIATLNLMDPPTVDSTFERNIADYDIPVVTICPINQTNYPKLMELKYYTKENVLRGETSCHDTDFCKSWGAHLNLTFDELKSQIFDSYGVDRINVNGGRLQDKPVFIPKYGMCQETSFVDVTQELLIFLPYPDTARVLITDKNYRSYFMPDIASHKGDKLFMESETKHFINVKIQERYLCENDAKPMTGEQFKQCVDDKIQEEFEQNNVQCVPPWLSTRKQCNQTYPEDFYGSFISTFLNNYLDMVSILSNIKFEEDCRQSCRETTYTVVEKGTKDDLFQSSASITFNQKVLVTEKVLNYDLFKYIIDVGSSLGLWLGLSILGLHDLAVMAAQFIRNNFVINKIKSAILQ